MKNNKKLILALIIASATTTIFPTAEIYAAEDKELEAIESLDNPTDIDKEIEELTITSPSYTSDNSHYFTDDEVTFPKNEADTRKSDGTNKFNRATETDRESFGEDDNVTNIDPEVEKMLKETDGEYGKKDGKYANNNLKAITSPIKNIVVNPGKNENEIAITWFAKGDVQKSKLVFDGKEYEPIRARKTGDSEGYSTYTAIVNITPGKSYKYYVISGTYKSETYTLTTKALGKDNEFSVAYFGDPQMGSGDSVWDSKGLNKNTQAKVDQDKIDFAKTINKARELDPHFYLSMGDNVEIVSLEGEYDYFLDNDLFKERIFSSVIGNHETYIDKNDSSQQNTVFSDHFYLPNESKLGSISKINEDGTPFYISGDYYYTYGDTLFINLNSNVIETKEHEAFIKEAIKKATKEHGKNFSWKVVSFHHAPYSTATHTSDDDILQRRNELVKVFNDNGIDIVLNGHDHIYARTHQMLAGEQALTFKEAYGTDPKNENSGIKDGFSETFNNKIYKNGKVIVDGIGLINDKSEITNPRGTLFLTMSASAGAKFYNPIGEDQWFVSRSLDDRSQLFSNLSFAKNRFSILTMDPKGTVVDSYAINKTDDFIANPHMNDIKTNKANLEKSINYYKNLKAVDNKENMDLFKQAIDKAILVLDDQNASQEAIDCAIEVLNTRMSEVEFLEDSTKEENSTNKKESKKIKEVKAPKAKVAKSNNPKTGVTTLTGLYAILAAATSALGLSKKRK